MRRFLIAGHGTLPDGILDAFNRIAGGDDRVTAIDAYTDHTALEDAMAPFFKKVKDDDEVVVFTDLLGGSVNQFFLKFLDRPHFHLISGSNLAVVIGVLHIPEEGYLSKERIEEELDLARNQLVYMNDYIKTFSFENNFET
ncbi:MAG: fructoselysine/glucoselysine system component [Clostridiales bacterium]|nr:fructoselysine/glucoselysine system component [Clostridiales bacterium]